MSDRLPFYSSPGMEPTRAEGTVLTPDPSLPADSNAPSQGDVSSPVDGDLGSPKACHRVENDINLAVAEASSSTSTAALPPEAPAPADESDHPANTEAPSWNGPHAPDAEDDGPPPVDADTVGGVDRVGSVVADRYRIVEELGSGTTGTVYRAVHLRITKTFAIKVLHPELSHVAEMVARFEREAVVAGRINHPNVAGAVDSGRLPDGTFYMVLEFVSGTSLRNHLDEFGALSVVDALAVGRQIASALVAAHAAGVVHRDLKPENVMLVGMVEGSPQIKVLDFGIAKLTQESDADGPALTRMGTIFGTPEYMSPEQAAGTGADERSDLYSLGIILHELLTGCSPFYDTEIITILTRQMNEPPPPLPETIALPIRLLVGALLEKSPSKRPSSATAVEAQLVQLLAESRPKPPPPAPFLRPSFLWYRSAFLGLLIVGTAIVVYRLHGAPSAPGIESHATSPTGIVHTNPLLERAIRGELDALNALEKLPEVTLTAEHWLAMGHGRAYNREWEGVMDAYERAVTLSPALLQDRRLVFNVSQATYHARASRRALDFAATRLGTRGADLIFATWEAAAGGRAPEADLKFARAKLDALAKGGEASPALRAYFAARDARSCAEVKRALLRVAQVGDNRSTSVLRRFLADRGCGLLGLADCYPCLRSGTELQSAIAAAKKRPNPDFSLSSIAPGEPSSLAPAGTSR